MHFCIRACDVSALAGRNVLRSRKVAIKRLVANKISFANTSSSTDQSDTKRIIDVIRRGQAYQRAVKCSRLLPEICTSAEEECNHIVRKLSRQQDAQRLFSRYRHLYLKDRGLVIEKIVIDKLKQQGHDIPTVTKQERSFSKSFTCLSGDHTYTIYGCVDCIEKHENGSTSLLEIKSRKSHQMNYTHELDQILTYLVISDWPQAYLVEYVNDSIFLSNKISLDSATATWNSHIRTQLERSIHEAAQKIVHLVP